MSENCERCGRELKDENAVGVTGGYVCKDEYFTSSDCDPYIAVYCKKCFNEREDIIENANITQNLKNNLEAVAKHLDIKLLRQERDWLVKQAFKNNDCPEADGIINLLDHLLDVAEGYAK